MTPVDRSELPGMEFDWLAADEAGNLAQMLSSGVGRIPEAALSSEETLFALHLFLDELPLTEPLSIPEGSFQALLAQPQRRGLFVYDAVKAAEGERTSEYILIAAPTQPLTLDRIPEELRGVVARMPALFLDFERLGIDGV
ncbi:hypothetical protein [Deinococcus altitudinis]|uniref:hypothetical protein n=1 Tax=Deinococcus altitudinis TaxID=468914 RepID=UPI00389293BE